MEIKYIFINKNKSDSNVYTQDIVDMLQIVFDNVDKDKFNLTIDNKTYTIFYKIYDNYLTLTANEIKMKNSSILSEANKMLTKGPHRKNYNIILAFDGVSQCYCDKIYPKFNLFERKIRELIYKILIKALGSKWVDETLNDNLKNKIKEKNKGKINFVEETLHEMTIYQLETYLFEPYRDINTSEIIDDMLKDKKIENMNREEIITQIKKARAECLWNRFFKDKVEIIDLQSKLQNIRIYRNKVAHCKFFYKEDYNDCNKLLKDITKQLEQAINNLEYKTLRENESYGSLAVFLETIKYFHENITSSIEPFHQKQIKEINISNTLSVFAETIKQFQKNIIVPVSVPNSIEESAKQLMSVSSTFTKILSEE